MASGRTSTGLVGVEDERRLPFVLVAVPTEAGATAFGLTPEQLDRHLVPALVAQPSELRAVTNTAMASVRGAGRLSIHTGEAELHAKLSGRVWVADDGQIDEKDQRTNAHVGDLSAGSIYTTVHETSTMRQLRLPEAAGARDVRLTYEGRCVVGIEAQHGDVHLAALFKGHIGDRDRVGHVGIGLNPALHEFVGWPVVGEHVHGALFVSLGENRYLGGTNASDLNIDFPIAAATLLVDDRVIVDRGKLAV
jgi:leucyl aminopeptidase (aminopeptidase T)